MTVSLSAQQSKLYEYLRGTGVDIDVAIVTLHFTLAAKTKKYRISDRMRQQIVGSTVSRTNKKIKEMGYVIVPGNLKHTYRLTAIVAAK